MGLVWELHGPTHQLLMTRIDCELKYPFIEYCFGLPSNTTAKIINIEIVSIPSSNEISLIKNASILLLRAYH